MSFPILVAGLVVALGAGHPPPSPSVPDAGAAFASGRTAASGSDEQGYRVFLLTMDQGDQVWEQFGHNALLIRDPEGRELVWNWGLFDFEDVDFIPRFLRGTMRYSMGPAETAPFLDAYARLNRTIYANEVYLDDDEALALDEFVRWNHRPENRAYTYHYFLDNCSTRLRDALDGVLGGLLGDRFGQRMTPESFRDHSRRLVQETLWVDQGLSFLLGARGDAPITEWEAMFVPMELMELMEGVERPDGEGGMRPLLGARDTLFLADRPPTPEEPPRFSFLWILGGLAAGGGIAALGAGASQGRRGATTGLAAAIVAWGLFSGALGGLLVAAWLTDHDFIHWNLNVLYISPLGPALAVVAAAALGRSAWREGRPGRLAAGLAAAIALLAVTAALLQLVSVVHQGNAEVIAVALPVNLAVAWSLLGLAGWAPAQPAPLRRSSA